jgi:hypothetical protein
MIQVSLYINSQIVNNTTGAITDNWINADLDDNVNIVLNDSIKDAKDVGKVMTAYTNQFKLPASKKNNRIFKYFHNHNVLNGFDARRKHEAIIKLNGFDYKKGYIKLNKVDLKDNSPLAYNIQFFGELTSLKDILGKAELRDLSSLNQYNHQYNITNVRNGFEEGLDIYVAPNGTRFVTKDPDGDIKYPLISHTRLFEYDNQKFHRLLSEEEKAAGYTVASADRLDHADLKPAIRVSKIFDAIEANFPKIKFNKDWIDSVTAKFGSPFDELFMWLHRDKGYLNYDINPETPDPTFDNLVLNLWRNLKDGNGDNEYDYTSGDGDIRPLEVRSSFNFKYFSGNFSVEGVGSGAVYARVRLLRNGVDVSYLATGATYSESGSISIDFDTRQDSNILEGDWEIITNVRCENSVGAVIPTLTIIQTEFGVAEKTSVYGGSAVSLVENVLVPLCMPKKKVIDFLSDLFKMFNLVAYEVRHLDGTYEIFIESLDSYYRKGTAYDITQYIDISESNVERISPYSYISLRFPEKKTFLAINQEKITGDDFGNVEFRVDSFDEGNNSTSEYLFDGGEYVIELKFEKVMYERLENKSVIGDFRTSEIQMGMYVNDNKEDVPEPVVGEALLFYAVNQPITEASEEYIRWSDGNNSQKYNRPSNVKEDDSQTLHFNEEFDEWTRQTNPNSLFNNFYKTYISVIYSSYARRVIVDAHLPSLIYSKIKLNDEVIINDIVFLIESIKTNLTTGKSSLKLLRATDIKPKYVVPSEGQLRANTDEYTWDERIEKWEQIIDGFGSYIEELLGDFEARVDKDGGVLDSSIGCVESAIRSLPDAETARVLFDAYDARCKAESGDTEARTCTIASLNEILL